MNDDVVDEIAQMLGPDAAPEQRLAARLILISRDNVRVLGLAKAALDQNTAVLTELKNRPTLGSATAEFLRSKAGGILTIGVANVAVMVLVGLATWFTGMLHLPTPPTAAAHAQPATETVAP